MKRLQYWNKEGRVSRSLFKQPRNDSSDESTEGQPTLPQTQPLTNSLPLRVLSEVFYWCTPTATDQEHSDPRFALTLSYVCSHWRAVALDSPFLWTYTKIKVIESVLDPAIQLLRLYLLRSKMLHVFVDVDFVCPSASFPKQIFYQPAMPFFEEIIDVVRQCKPANALEDSFFVTHLEASSTDRQPMREEWYFWSARTAEASSLTSAPLTGSEIQPSFDFNSKSLTRPGPEPSVTIRASHNALGAFMLKPYLPWASSLTSITIKDLNNYTNLTLRDTATILRAFPVLAHCSIHIDFEDNDVLPLEPMQPVELLRLESLSLSWPSWVDPGPLIDALYSPSLQELDLRGGTPDTVEVENWHHLGRFLQRSSPPLSWLILERFDSFHAPLLDALAHVPSLVGLWLEDCLLDNALIHGLRAIGLLSSLHTFVLCECGSVDAVVLAQSLKESATESHADSQVMVHVVDCGDVTSDHALAVEEMGVSNLEIRLKPPSIEFDRSSSDDEI
ncbi:hypothetical protein EW145_g5820 [Phellinidium pouzarii]|uniref:Uncharacterized protein n=1 Tax=Phellinidium pouzarii TaxID=167371 RepID=A0A4S4KZ87_9AGAM|nr:hypothetical protein EW145_g5820 [Phellinidium pouzarii]